MWFELFYALCNLKAQGAGYACIEYCCVMQICNILFIRGRDVGKLNWKIQQQKKLFILTLKLRSCFSFTYCYGY